MIDDEAERAARPGGRRIDFVYHRKRPDFRGDQLVPLTDLQRLHPDLHAAAAAKYRGREWTMAWRIPILDVLWNDVVHCSPLHPHLVYRALHARAPDRFGEAEYFAIPVARFAHRRAVYWKFAAPPYPARAWDAWSPAERAAWAADFEPFAPGRHRPPTDVPPVTLAHYDEMLARGQPVLLVYYGIPHVQVAGAIDVADLAVVRWSEPPGAPERPA
jgi:hypothetical protein